MAGNWMQINSLYVIDGAEPDILSFIPRILSYQNLAHTLPTV